jgi:Arc/MetJ-type ribon-helix-helix transcriptional regulator
MEVTINGNAEMIVKKLVELGRFPSADSAVNEVILRTFSDLSDQLLAQSTLLDPPIAFDEQVQVPDFPYRTRQLVAVVTVASHRLPDPMDTE